MIEWLQGLPAEWGNYVSILLFVGLGVMVWLIPIKAITADLQSPKSGRTFAGGLQRSLPCSWASISYSDSECPRL